MKYFVGISFLILTNLTSSAAQDEEIKFGLEGLTTWRSEYIYRGFKLAEKTMEFQIAGQLALSDSKTIDAGLYYDTATGAGDFSEVGTYLDFSKNIGDLTYSAKLTLRDYSNSSFKSGADIGGAVNWKINNTFDLTSTLAYDTGAEGAYAEIKASAYKELSTSSFLIFKTGIGATADYYDRSGLHHLFAQLEYTYNISENVSISPFLGTSIGIHDEAVNSLFIGLYFAVNF
jgi:hypothetical protein